MLCTSDLSTLYIVHGGGGGGGGVNWRSLTIRQKSIVNVCAQCVHDVHSPNTIAERTLP